MNKKSDGRKPVSSIIVLIIVAGLAVLAFFYLSTNKLDRELNAHQPASEPTVVVDHLDKEQIYSDSPKENSEPESSTNPKPGITQQEDIPAEPSIDPIIEGQTDGSIYP